MKKNKRRKVGGRKAEALKMVKWTCNFFFWTLQQRYQPNMLFYSTCWPIPAVQVTSRSVKLYSQWFEQEPGSTGCDNVGKHLLTVTSRPYRLITISEAVGQVSVVYLQWLSMCRNTQRAMSNSAGRAKDVYWLVHGHTPSGKNFFYTVRQKWA